jgi:AcrR family transcriptional regulator
MVKSSTRHKSEEDGTRDILMHHALVLVSELGFEAVSLREIARSAGFSHMAPYKHFKDKEALFAAIVEQGFEKLSADFLRIEQDVLDPEKRYFQMGEAYIRFATNNPQQFKLMFSGFLENSDDHPRVKEVSDECFTYLLRLIEYCQFHKFIKKGSLDEISAFIWSHIHGFSCLWIEGCFEKVEKNLDPKNLEKFIHKQIAMTLRGIQ